MCRDTTVYHVWWVGDETLQYIMWGGWMCRDTTVHPVWGGWVTRVTTVHAVWDGTAYGWLPTVSYDSPSPHPLLVPPSPCPSPTRWRSWLLSTPCISYHSDLDPSSFIWQIISLYLSYLTPHAPVNMPLSSSCQMATGEATSVDAACGAWW